MKQPGLVRSLVSLMLTRLIVNMARRFPYPYLPDIARSLDVPLSSVQAVMGVNAGIGITSPLFGPLAERYGRKRVMMGALVFMSLAALLAAILPQFWIFAATMIALGVGKMVFDPTMLAYIGDNVPYARRGMAIGFTEFSWAGSLFIIAPLAGFLLERSTLQAVFAVLAALSVVGLLIVYFNLPADHPKQGYFHPISPLAAWRTVRGNPHALGALAYVLFLVAANEIFYINYGSWMEASFDLTLLALGVASTVIPAAEICGEMVVIGVADRFGKRRLALIGALGAAVFYLVLPTLAQNLTGALAGIFCLFFCFEIAIVASIPLFTEIMPNARSVMMSSVFAAQAIGRPGGAFLGGLLYGSAGNFGLVGIAALVIGLTAAVMLWRFVPEQGNLNHEGHKEKH